MPRSTCRSRPKRLRKVGRSAWSLVERPSQFQGHPPQAELSSRNSTSLEQAKAAYSSPDYLAARKIGDRSTGSCVSSRSKASPIISAFPNFGFPIASWNARIPNELNRRRCVRRFTGGGEAGTLRDLPNRVSPLSHKIRVPRAGMSPMAVLRRSHQQHRECDAHTSIDGETKRMVACAWEECRDFMALKIIGRDV